MNAEPFGFGSATKPYVLQFARKKFYHSIKPDPVEKNACRCAKKWKIEYVPVEDRIVVKYIHS